MQMQWLAHFHALIFSQSQARLIKKSMIYTARVYGKRVVFAYGIRVWYLVFLTTLPALLILLCFVISMFFQRESTQSQEITLIQFCAFVKLRVFVTVQRFFEKGVNSSYRYHTGKVR